MSIQKSMYAEKSNESLVLELLATYKETGFADPFLVAELRRRNVLHNGVSFEDLSEVAKLLGVAPLAQDRMLHTCSTCLKAVMEVFDGRCLECASRVALVKISKYLEEESTKTEFTPYKVSQFVPLSTQNPVQGYDPCATCGNNPKNNPHASGICCCALPYMVGPNRITCGSGYGPGGAASTNTTAVGHAVTQDLFTPLGESSPNKKPKK